MSVTLHDEKLSFRLKLFLFTRIIHIYNIILIV